MRRFAIFASVLLVLVIVGSRPRAEGSDKRSICVCMASRAALLMKSITTTANTSAQASRPVETALSAE